MPKDTSSTPGQKHRGATIIKTIYFYAVSLIALLMIVLPAASLTNLVIRDVILKVESPDYSYPVYAPDGKAVEVDQAAEKVRREKEQGNQTKRDIARDVSFLIVGIPLFIFNWRLIKRNKISE